MSESTTRPAQYIELDGVMWPTMVTVESLQAIKDFETWEDDVWVSTYPKAGKKNGIGASVAEIWAG